MDGETQSGMERRGASGSSVESKGLGYSMISLAVCTPNEQPSELTFNLIHLN